MLQIANWNFLTTGRSENMIKKVAKKKTDRNTKLNANTTDQFEVADLYGKLTEIRNITELPVWFRKLQWRKKLEGKAKITKNGNDKISAKGSWGIRIIK